MFDGAVHIKLKFHPIATYPYVDLASGFESC